MSSNWPEDPRILGRTGSREPGEEKSEQGTASEEWERESESGDRERDAKESQVEKGKTNKLTSESLVYCWVGTR